MASTIFDHDHSSGPPVRDAGLLMEKSALELCEYALSGSLLERSVGLAAINSLVEVDLNRCRKINAEEVLLEKDRDALVMVLGPTTSLLPVWFRYGVDLVSVRR